MCLRFLRLLGRICNGGPSVEDMRHRKVKNDFDLRLLN